MKVVLFCGGLGLRARDGADGVPKPLQLVGQRPLLWHVMKYYAHWGHTDFVLCTGFGSDRVVSWFTENAVAALPEPGQGEHLVLRLRGGDMDGWRVTFADTGMQASVGMRLRAVRPLLEDEPMFFANYADVFSDVPLPELVDCAERSDATAVFLAVPPNHSFHVVQMEPEGWVTGVTPAVESDQYINGGFFVLRPEVFDVLGPGEELVEEPFARLAAGRRLLAHRYRGFWHPMDTAKDRHRLEALWTGGTPPWALWQQQAPQRTCRPA